MNVNNLDGREDLVVLARKSNYFKTLISYVSILSCNLLLFLVCKNLVVLIFEFLLQFLVKREMPNLIYLLQLPYV